MAFGAKRLIEIVRDMARDATPGDQFTDEILLDYINSSMWYYLAKCAVEGKQYFVKSSDITYVSGGTEIFRWAKFVKRVVLFERTDLDPNAQVPYIHPIYRHSFLGVDGADSENVYLRGTKLGVVPAQTSGTLRVWHHATPPPLHYGTATAGAAATITFPTAATKGTVMVGANDYDDMPIILTSGTGGTLQTNVIDSYAATKVATVKYTWTTNPSTDTVYELCPPLPEEFHMMVALRASKFAKVATEDLIGDLLEMEKDFESLFLAYISADQEQVPQMIMQYGWGNDSGDSY